MNSELDANVFIANTLVDELHNMGTVVRTVTTNNIREGCESL